MSSLGKPSTVHSPWKSRDISACPSPWASTHHFKPCAPTMAALAPLHFSNAQEQPTSGPAVLLSGTPFRRAPEVSPLTVLSLSLPPAPLSTLLFLNI